MQIKPLPEVQKENAIPIFSNKMHHPLTILE